MHRIYREKKKICEPFEQQRRLQVGIDLIGQNRVVKYLPPISDVFLGKEQCFHEAEKVPIYSDQPDLYQLVVSFIVQIVHISFPL